MTTNEDISTLKDQDERNKLKVYCTFCPSKMLNAGVARLVNIEVNHLLFFFLTQSVNIINVKFSLKSRQE